MDPTIAPRRLRTVWSVQDSPPRRIPALYSYPTCSFNQSYQSPGFQNQFSSYAGGYATANYHQGVWSHAAKGVAGPNAGVLEGACYPLQLDTERQLSKDNSHNSNKDKKSDSNSSTTYKGPVYGWMKIPGKNLLRIPSFW